jgi:hypothetical protein
MLLIVGNTAVTVSGMSAEICYSLAKPRAVGCQNSPGNSIVQVEFPKSDLLHPASRLASALQTKLADWTNALTG